MKKSFLFAPIAAGFLALFPMATKALCAPPDNEAPVEFTKVRISTAWSEVEGKGFSGICTTERGTTVGDDLVFSSSGERAIQISPKIIWVIKNGTYTTLTPKDKDYTHFTTQLSTVCTAFQDANANMLGPDTEPMNLLYRQINGQRMRSISVSVTSTPASAAQDPRAIADIERLLKAAPPEMRAQIKSGDFAPKTPPKEEDRYNEGEIPAEFGVAFGQQTNEDAAQTKQDTPPQDPPYKTPAKALDEHAMMQKLVIPAPPPRGECNPTGAQQATP